MNKKVLVNINPQGMFTIQIEGKFWSWLFHKLYHVDIWEGKQQSAMDVNSSILPNRLTYVKKGDIVYIPVSDDGYKTKPMRVANVTNKEHGAVELELEEL